VVIAKQKTKYQPDFDLLRLPYKNRAFKFLSYLANIKLLPKLMVSNEYHRSFASAELAGYVISLYFCLF